MARLHLQETGLAPVLRRSAPNADFFGYVNPASHLNANGGLHYYIVEEILSHIPLPNLRTLSMCSKFWYDAVRDFIGRKYSKMLQRYFQDDVGFRKIMRSTGSIISGSEALDFALHGTVTPAISSGGMDVYANCLYALKVVIYLRDIEGYTVIIDKRGPDGVGLTDYGGNIVSVTTLVNKRLGSKVQVICVAQLSAVHQLVLFWSTLVMVLLTADGISIAYPALTLAGRGVISPLTRHNAKRQDCIDKYRQRGFDIVDFLGNVPLDKIKSIDPSFNSLFDIWHPTISMVKWNCPDTIRTWKDEGCFAMSFSKGEEKAARWTRPFSAWLMGGKQCGGGCDPDSKPTVWVQGVVALVMGEYLLA